MSRFIVPRAPAAPHGAGMDATAKLIDDIILREGGFVDHPADRGGPTKHGITQATLARWRGAPVTRDDVAELTFEDARQIYRRLYIDDPGFHHIFDRRLQAAVVDAGVHHGPATAARWLQAAVGARPDGVIGPRTIEAMRGAPPDRARRGVVRQRVQYMVDVVARGPSQLVFLRGWIARALAFLED